MFPLDVNVPTFEEAWNSASYGWMKDPNSHCPACGQNPKGVAHKCSQEGYRSHEALEAAEEFNSFVEDGAF